MPRYPRPGRIEPSARGSPPARHLGLRHYLAYYFRDHVGHQLGNLRARLEVRLGPMLLAPQCPGEQERTRAHRDVGHVEGRPTPVAEADVHEVHDADRRAYAVDEIADRSPAHQAEHEEDLARPRTQIEAERRARVVHQR